MAHPVYLTKDEQKMFMTKIPKELLEEVNIIEESLVAMETPDVLATRMKISRLRNFPEVMGLVEKIKKGSTIEDLAGFDFPEAVLHELCFTMGAKGLTGFIRDFLRYENIGTIQELAALVAFTVIRHDILEVNAAIPSSH
jgi:hypothetical protein